MKRCLPLFMVVIGLTLPVFGGETLEKTVVERFKSADTKEVPNFRRHVVPLMGRLGCNGRACHGSFQGQGGFRRSLFGYDFDMDHGNLTKADEENKKDARVDLDFPEDSLMVLKPTLDMPHKGGKRMDVNRWEYNLFMNWIKAGAKNVDLEKEAKFEKLEVTPKEIVFQGNDESVQLKAIAVWSDGSREDVTPMCRFKSNDDQIANIDENGLVEVGKSGDTHVVVFYDNGVVPIPVMRPVSKQNGDDYPEVEAPTIVDQLVVQKLRKLGIVPSEKSADAEFLRRVRIDITGTLPTASEVESFLNDTSDDKRARKINELLETPEYAAWWTTKLCDLTGNNDDNLNNVVPRVGNRYASTDWFEWINKRVQDNMPYDELMAGIVVANSRNPGESYRDYCEKMSEIYRPDSKVSFAENRQDMPYYWARRNFRTPEERAIGFAYTFMGIRIQCAQCHKHPFDQWTQVDFKQFTNFFTSVAGYRARPTGEAAKEYNALVEELGIKKLRGNELRRKLPEMIRAGKTVPFSEVMAIKPRPNNNRRPNNRNQPVSSRRAKLLGAEVIDLTKIDDSRKPLMDWLRRKENPYFAKAFVNRVWAGYFNVGIVDPPDDLSLANPPSNQALLDHLAMGFIDNNFDMKWLHREIANSRTYQTSWVPNEANRLDERNFSHSIPRRMPAEVAYDALQQATSSNSEVDKIRVASRAIALPSAGRRSQNRGTTGYALTIFGRSIRESNCDCDRTSEASLLQTIYLQNDKDVQALIDRDRGGWLNSVANDLGLAKKKAIANRPPNYEKILASLKARVKKFRKAGNEGQTKAAQVKLDQYLKRFGDDGSKKKKGDVKVDSIDAVIKQAYLRTVNRYPSNVELDRTTAYIEASEDKVDGIRDVLWALLNTKEFIVNR